MKLYRGNIPLKAQQNPENYARIIQSFGRHFIVELTDARRFECVTRARRKDFVCGDWVKISLENDRQAVIEDALPRQSLLYRSDAFRSKILAANVDQIAVVVAAKPCFSEDFLSSCLIAAHAAKIETFIILNKTDLPETTAARTQLQKFIALGYDVIEVCAKQDISLLINKLHGKLSLFIGQSGMGKSTLTNAIIPEAKAKTNDWSRALDSGKHTTTHASLYAMDEHSALIDSPGLQEFGLYHLDFETLFSSFPEFTPYQNRCRFQDCQHEQEPDCAIQDALARGEIAQNRFDLFHRLRQNLNFSKDLNKKNPKKSGKPKIKKHEKLHKHDDVDEN